MIISPTHKFVFVHVPKCAGTSVRTQLIKCDPEHISLGEVKNHPELGPIDYGHIFLSTLRVHFPEYYANVRDYESYAVLRDPLERFGSSLRQTLWHYEGKPMTLIPKDELRQRTLQILDEAAAEIDQPSARMIFFARQRDFVFDGDTRLVDHLVPLGMVPDFIRYMSQSTGVPLAPETRSNQNIDLRYKGLGPLAFRINAFLRRSLPLDLHAKIKDTAVKFLAKPGSAAQSSGVLDLPEVQDFVAEYYKDDLSLYKTALAEQPALLDRFTTPTKLASG